MVKIKRNKKNGKKKRQYCIVSADKSPYSIEDWEKEINSDFENVSIEEIFIGAVDEMKLEKIKFIVKNDFIDFNKECPLHMQSDEEEYPYGSIYDKAIYESLSKLIYSDYDGYMEVVNELLKCKKINYNLLYATLPYCYEWFEKKFVDIITKVSNSSSEIFLVLDRYLSSVYTYEDVSNFISIFNKLIISNGININYFPNLFISACWLDYKELVEFFIENKFNYNSNFNKDTMDEVIVDSSKNCETIIQVAYNLVKMEGAKEVLCLLEKLI